MPVAISGTTGISGVDGSAGTPAVQGSDTNTGVFYPAADTIAFSEGGTEVMRINSAGNVGIGTTTPTQKLDVAGSINASGTMVMGSSFLRNRIINGAMVIDQRNAGASVTPTSGQYTLDRWSASLAQASKFSVQQNAGSVTPPTGHINYLGVTSLSAYSVLTGDFFLINQAIEGLNVYDLGWGAAGAQSVTLSFWVRSSLTGTFGGAINNSAGNRSYPFTYSISSANTWEQKSITIPGDTSGTWLTTNGVGIMLRFGLGVGATSSGTAGTWAAASYFSATGATSVVGTNAATWYITGVQLEAGSVATPFERRLYGQELALCQRYYETINISSSGAASTNMSTSSRYAVVKRTAPSVTRTGNWATVNEAGTAVSLGETAQIFIYNPTTNALAVGGQFTASAEL